MNEFAEKLDQLLRDHTPSLSDEAEREIDARWEGYFSRESYDIPDYADLAIRTCSCGVRIDGYYEYLAHLREVSNVQRAPV